MRVRANTLDPAEATHARNNKTMPIVFTLSMPGPFAMKIDTTPNTDTKTDSFCRTFVLSCKKMDASTSVMTGVKADKMPPSADVAYLSPNACRTKKLSGYIAAKSTAL